MHTYMQRDAMDCGPSCLAMITEYYGKTADIAKLRQLCSLGKDGVSLLSISKAAEKIGFKTLGGCLDFDMLTCDVPLPCIAHWNQNHFVVVYKVRKRKNGKYIVFVADPGKGLLTYSKEEFSEHWISTKYEREERGVVLLLEPTMLFFEQQDTEIAPTQNRIKFLLIYYDYLTDCQFRSSIITHKDNIKDINISRNIKSSSFS